MRDLATWTDRGHQMTVAINVSVRNLHNRHLPRVLDYALAWHCIDPGSVDLEITESAVMDDFDQGVQLIGQMRDRGFSVSIYDFGTGNSSMAYLKQLPVTKLKIDQAFIRHLATMSVINRSPEHHRSRCDARPGKRCGRGRRSAVERPSARMGVRLRARQFPPRRLPL